VTFIALWAVAMLIGVSSGAASAASFTSAELFPFQGPLEVMSNYWSFESSDFDLGTLMLLPGVELVNGVPTRVIRSTGPAILGVGADEFFTNDQSGLRLHGAGIEIFGCAGRIELSPPIVLMPAAVSTGQATPTTGTGNVSATCPGQAPIAAVVDFQTNATLVSVESISVPAGHFDAAKFDLFIRLAGTVNGNSLLIEGTESHWYAPGVGPVRIIPPPVANLNVNIIPPPPPTFTTWRLTQYYVPEPSTAASTGAALLAILALARRVRWPRRDHGWRREATRRHHQ